MVLITETFEILLETDIATEIRATRVNRENIEGFKQYMRNQWVPFNPRELSVYRVEAATANSMEHYHKQLNSLMLRAHPNPWHFLEHLNHMLDVKTADFEKVCAYKLKSAF